jgi:tellurite resistance protein
MDETTARRASSLVAAVLCTDGKLGAEEHALLKRVMVRFGLETDTALMPTSPGDMASELDSLPEDIRWEMLFLVVQAAAADGVIVPEERALVDVVAGYLGVAEPDVVEMFRRALDTAGPPAG